MSAVKGNARSSGYERNANEYYVEPPRAVTALLAAETFVGAIHDPACGGGNIPRTARECCYEATGSDIVDRGFGETRDFLTDYHTYPNIITNPPFSLAVDFALHALDHVAPSGKVAILQRLSWLEGTRRHSDLFKRGHLHRILVFSGRISMPPGGTDVPAQNGSIAYAWFVFSPRSFGLPTLGWLS